MSFLVELWTFEGTKKFWLFPVMFMMVIFGGLLVLSQGSAVAPFIYTIFENLAWHRHAHSRYIGLSS